MNQMSDIFDRAGISFDSDPVGNQLLRTNSAVPQRAERFSALQQHVATNLGGNPDSLPWHLVCFEGVIGEDALRSAFCACSTVHQHPEGVAIEWQSHHPIRTERRVVSDLTNLALQRFLRTGPREALNLDVWNAACGSTLVEWGLYRQVTKAMEQMWADSACWHLVHLPMPLWGHVSGLQTLSALTRTAWARQASGMIAPSEAAQSPAVQVLPRALDAASSSLGKDTDASAMNALDVVMKSSGSLSNSAQRRTWVEKLSHTIELANRCGPVSCLVIAWSLDMAESGTPFKPNAAAATIQRYVRSVMWQLWKAFTAQEADPEDMSVKDFACIYQEILAPMNGSVLAAARQALGSWHKFLVQFQDAPVIRGGLARDLLDTPVDAQVIWPHELARVSKSLANHTGDERVRGGAQVLFHIACNGAFREDEIARLRMANVVVHEGAVDIEIISSQRYGGLKSPAAQRVVRITDANACNQIQEWKRRRSLERAGLSDLLFGDPVGHGIYRRNTMVQMVNAAVKSATGGQGTSMHGLRHSFLSDAADGLFRSMPTGSINRFATLGNEAGHASPVTTLTSYCHRYEAGLRLHLDAGMHQSVRWPNPKAAHVLGIKEATLRQHVHRRGCSLQDVFWTELRAQTTEAKFAPIEADLHLIEYQARPGHTQAPALTIPTTLKILEDLMAGLSKESAASRHQTPLATVEVLEASALTLAESLSGRRRTSKRSEITLASAMMSVQTALLFAGVDLERRHQSKYTALNAFLADVTQTSEINESVKAWKGSLKGKHLSFDKTGDVIRLLRFFKKTGVPCASLRLRLAIPGGRPELAHVLAARHLPLWKTVYGETPVVETCIPRTGRPDAYLLWTSKQDSEVTPSAAGETGGLSAWLFGANLWADIKAKEQADA